MTNVFVNGGPWESDLAVIRKSGFYAEFEVKHTKADFNNDAKKSARVNGGRLWTGVRFMSHEITSKDGLALFKNPAWHGLGTIVTDAMSPSKALEVADMGWKVDQWEMQAKRVISMPDYDGSELREEIGTRPATMVANVRRDTQ